MTFPTQLRPILSTAIAALLLLSAATAVVAAPPASMRRASQAGRPPANTPHSAPAPKANAPKGNAPKGNQEHLPQWMARHSNLSPTEQQKALENEPGFRDLPPQTQQA